MLLRNPGPFQESCSGKDPTLLGEFVMQCPSCRHESSGSLCSFCGAALAAAPEPSTSAGPGPSANLAAAIAYLTIVPSIIFLVLEPYKRTKLVKFHSIQNIVLTAALVIVYFSLGILSTVLGAFVPFIGFLFLFLYSAAGIGFFVFWLLALVMASKGEYFKLPYIGAFAAKLAGV